MEDSSHTQRSYSFPSLQHHWHTDLETLWGIIKSQTASTESEEEEEEVERENPSKPTPFGIKNLHCALRQILSSDVFALKFNCEKSLSEAAVHLAAESWGLQRHSGPPAQFPSSSSTRATHIPTFSNQFSLSIPLLLFHFPLPMLHAVKSNKQAGVFVISNSGKSYLLAQNKGCI